MESESEDFLPDWCTHPAGRACLDRNFDELRKLGAAGVTIDDIAEDDGDSHLHRASGRGDVALVGVLLEIGCLRCLNGFNYIGFTPLATAVMNGREDVVRLLLAAGADVNAHCEAKIGETALDVFFRGAHIVVPDIASRLLDAGADPTIRTWMGLNAIDRAEQAIGDRLLELRRWCERTGEDFSVFENATSKTGSSDDELDSLLRLLGRMRAVGAKS